MSRWPLLALILALAAPGLAQEAARAPLIKRSAKTTVMGTSLDIAVLGTDVAVLDRAILAAVKEMRRVEAVFTTWNPESIASRVNQQAGGSPVKVPAELLALVKEAREISELTEGGFDLSWGAVGKLWDFKNKENPSIPSKERIAEALNGIGYRRIEVDEAASTLRLPRGMAIGFGGIAKGYGVDRAIAVLKAAGIRHAIVNAGGDLRVIGRDGRKPFNVTIKHPRIADRFLAILPVSNVAVVTSGDYERYLMIEGRRYSHILDPRTGFPVAHCQAVTLLAPTAARADALATGVFVLGPKKGLALVESLPGVEALIVDGEGAVHVSRGLKGAQEKTLHLPR